MIEEGYKQFIGDDDPYLVAKSVFLLKACRSARLKSRLSECRQSL